MSTPSGQFRMEVVTASGRAAEVRFMVEPERVEVWHCDQRRGVFDRGVLRQWLADPGAPLVEDEVTFSVDRMVDRDGRVAVSVPDVTDWTLAPVTLAELQKQV